jgi:hypothetical protein
VVSMVLIAAAFEAVQEWLQRGGRDNMIDLVNRAMDAVHMSQRLDALASSSPTIR